MSGNVPEIREHMEVVGDDGGHVGTVDKVEGDRIKLTKEDDPDGSGQHHHFLPVSSIGSVSGDQVRLNMPAARARALATISGGSEPSPGMGRMSGG
jgi:hypothetical protein